MTGRSFAPPFRIGVDVGGTFTDVVLVDSIGTVKASKTPSEPADPAASVVRALRQVAAEVGRELPGMLRECNVLVHGSTIAVNTILEKKGARVGLLTTSGFRDSLEIRRGIRRDVWNYREPNPEVLVPRYLRRPVRGRLDAEGKQLVPLAEADIAAAVELFRHEKVESIAICFLHGYRNPVHEHRARDVVSEMWPEVAVSCSADVMPVLGEYERTSTTVLNAYVTPRVVPYLSALERDLAGLGLAGDLLLMQSNGGAIAVNEIAGSAIHLVLSGPAAGVGALRYFGADSRSDRLVAIEIGGTSCDVTLATGGGVAMTDQIAIDDYHISLPAVQIHTVGAGGGTIAHVDAAGLLHAGPQGAGAKPGPAAYGLGGTRATVTDAQVVLGRLRPGPHAGAAIVLDLEQAMEAVTRDVALPLNLPVDAAAAGIIRLVEQNIRNAVERVSVERGHNPRQFTLVAAGGAGPMHGSPVARALGCPAVYVPRLAGVFCAFGMCNTDLRHDYQRPWLSELGTADMTAMAAAFSEIAEAGRTILKREGFEGDRVAVGQAMDLRYTGQQWTIPVATPHLDAVAIRRTFEAEHERLYGYAQPRGVIEVVNLKLTVSGRIGDIGAEPAPAARGKPRPTDRRLVWLDEARGRIDMPVYLGAGLEPGHSIDGPAIVEEATTTILVGAGDRLTVTPGNNYLIAIESAGTATATPALEALEG